MGQNLKERSEGGRVGLSVECAVCWLCDRVRVFQLIIEIMKQIVEHNMHAGKTIVSIITGRRRLCDTRMMEEAEGHNLAAEQTHATINAEDTHVHMP